jgi:hypothetical protein
MATAAARTRLSYLRAVRDLRTRRSRRPDPRARQTATLHCHRKWLKLAPRLSQNTGTASAPTWRMLARRSLVLVALALAASASAACSADVDSLEQSEETLSATRARVVPGDDASRAACREAAGKVYCSETEAKAALKLCSPGGANGKVSIETKSAACAATGPAYPTLASCQTPLELDCSYYAACLERAVPCGNDGYALGFGEKYCTAFRAAPLSAAGKEWVTHVMGCLQRALVPDVVAAGAFASSPASKMRCDEVFQTAFDSHPGCYTAQENSICFLPPGDLAVVLQTIGIKEILTARTGIQMLSTAGICIGQLTRRLFGFDRPPTSATGIRSIALQASEQPELPREDVEAALGAWKRIEAENAAAVGEVP